MIVCLDWDGTLVDVNQEWLPGAADALRRLSKHHKVYIQSCRAGWPEGCRSIVDKLVELRLHHITVSAEKPFADVYVDDKGLRFEGWPKTFDLIHGR